MNYQEAIDILKKNKPTNDPRRCGKELCTACDVAISAMQELQGLHDQGFSLDRMKDIDFRKEVVEHINYDAYMILMDELEEYRQLGDLEEVRESMQELQIYKENEKRNLSRTDRLMDECAYRHENGNCLKVGGFCTSVPLSHCQRYKDWYTEYRGYKQIGTLEEVREAVQELQGLQSETKCSDDAIALDEAIIHAREIAEKNYLQGMLCHANPNDDELDSCIECGREHEQLADWLEELKKYRQFGTPEGYRSALEAYEKCYLEKEEIANELYKYKQLGTLEEVREVVGKQNAKKPEKGEPYQWIDSVRVKGKYRDVRKTSYGHACHNCGKRVVKDMNFCRSCGQHIDWSDEE